MTQETMQTLNNKVLVGYGQKGAMWHRMRELMDEENVYEGPIPVEDIMRRLFNFEVELCKLIVERPDGRRFEQDKFFAQCPDNQDIIYGTHKAGYRGHQYKKWLIEFVQQMLGEDIGISSAACLREGAMAFVSVRLPELMKTKHGVEFFSYLMAITSFDMTCSTQYKTGNVLPICDNTAECMMWSAGNHFRLKHTRNSESEASVKDAMAALKLLEQEQVDFEAQCNKLCEREVTDAQFEKFISELIPLPEIAPRDINERDYSTRSATIAVNRRQKLNEMYRKDGRVSPWQGTAFGVVQLMNTFNQWESKEHKDGRVIRNAVKSADGSIRRNDINTLKLLDKVCA